MRAVIRFVGGWECLDQVFIIPGQWPFKCLWASPSLSLAWSPSHRTVVRRGQQTLAYLLAKGPSSHGNCAKRGIAKEEMSAAVATENNGDVQSPASNSAQQLMTWNCAAGDWLSGRKKEKEKIKTGREENISSILQVWAVKKNYCRGGIKKKKKAYSLLKQRMIFSLQFPCLWSYAVYCKTLYAFHSYEGAKNSALLHTISHYSISVHLLRYYFYK